MVTLESRQDAIDARIDEHLSGLEPPALADSVRHAALAGGKRVRPTVTLYMCEALGGTTEEAMEYAVGIELVHAASLVVDDIIDRSNRRRDTASAWATYGHGGALTASDGLIGEAFSLFSSDTTATQIVASAMGSLGAGEATELVAPPETREGYEELATRKTGALFRAAAELGAHGADAREDSVALAGEYGERVGVAFQIRDDVLDETSTASTLGKPTGRDEAMDRPSVIRATDLSPEDATTLAERHADSAIHALESLDVVDDEAGTYLESLARYTVERDR